MFGIFFPCWAQTFWLKSPGSFVTLDDKGRKSAKNMNFKYLGLSLLLNA